MSSSHTIKVTADDQWLASEGERGGVVPLSYASARGADAATRRRIAKARALLDAGRVDDARVLARAAMTIDDYRVSEFGINEGVAGAIVELNTAVADAARKSNEEPGRSGRESREEVVTVAEHSYAGSVSHTVVSVDVQRHGAGPYRPSSVVARVRVRYSYPDAPDRTHGFLFSQEGGGGEVYMNSMRPSGPGVSVDSPDRHGSFSVDPVSWVHSFYA